MKKLPRRKFLKLAGLATASAALPAPAFAQAYPNRPLKFVVPFPAGGATDILARILVQPLSEQLGQQVIIENKPGGGTNIAVQQVVNSPADGHTFIMTVTSMTINPWLQKSQPFEFQRDILPVSGLAEQPLVLDMHPGVPARNFAEFIAHCKANPGKVAFASFGARTISHLALELVKASTGIDVVHVPYQGGAPMLTDLIAGRVHAGTDALPNSVQHIRSGAVIGLGVFSKGRSPNMPDVPALSETIPGLQADSWVGIGVPRGTPADVVDRLNRAMNAALTDANLKARYADLGSVPLIITPAQTAEKIAENLQKWKGVVDRAGLTRE